MVLFNGYINEQKADSDFKLVASFNCGFKPYKIGPQKVANYFKKIIIPATILLLLAFTVYLSISIFTTKDWGMSGNCGCYGQWLPMNPFESAIKNLVLIGIIIWIYKHTHTRARDWKIPTILMLAGYLFIFILN